MEQNSKNYYFRLNLDDEDDRKVSRILDKQKNRAAFIRNAMLKACDDKETGQTSEEKIKELIVQSTKQIIDEIRQVREEENDWEKIKM